MNDTSETNWVDRQLIDKENLSDLNAKITNNMFILSLCDTSMMDILTMWRLYGDDTKGVCLVYEVKSPLPKGFYLKKVEYGAKPILVTLKAILERCKGGTYNGANNTWKHFFKPKEYEIEDEYRLLYDKAKGESHVTEKWIHNTSYNIIHPIILFDGLTASNNFPLQLKKVILGPNMPEGMTNARQIKEWLRLCNLNVEVEQSRIECYRIANN